MPAGVPIWNSTRRVSMSMRAVSSAVRRNMGGVGSRTFDRGRWRRVSVQEASVIELKRGQLAEPDRQREMLGLLQFAGHDADFNGRQL